ncbi:MAG: nucleoside 2-deoxyribosyltransferase [Prevotella sp.]|nr:nucleoside 2-deoxyribosyltransferase [Prevotella sp.]
MEKVYFASPWFTPEQEEREERLKAKLRELGFDVWSPKEEAVVGTFSDNETRQKIFDGNVDNIVNADIVFAITDGKDMGTIWEAGFAYGYNGVCAMTGAKPIKIVYYCETLGDGKFNLMLAQSGDIVITKFEDVDKLPDMLAALELGEKKGYVGKVE